MSKNIKSVALGLATSLVAPVASFANPQDTVSESSNLSRAVTSMDKVGKVTGLKSNDFLNVRQSATTSSSSIGKMGNGETLVITGKDGEWYQINYYGKTGYVYENYAQIVGDISFKKTTEYLNLRKTNVTSAEILTVIPEGATVRVLSESNGWSRVYYNGKFGYVYTKYLSLNTNTNSNTNSNTNTNPTDSSTLTSLNKEGKVVKVASNDTLNVRSLPNTSGSIVAKLANGTKVQVIGQDKATGWYKISYNGKVGYVGNYYISIVGDWNDSSTSTTMYTKTNLNFRTGPSTNYSIITNIPTGSAVTCYNEESNGWVKIKYNGTNGYVNSSYLTSVKPETETTKKVTTTNVNLRSGAGTNYSIIKTVASNTTVEVISTSGSWSKVKVGSDTGYMSSTYLTDPGSSDSDLVPSKPLYSKVKVVVDAGHGGTDPGAIGNGLREKDIVLSVSNKVNSKLKSLGFSTIMTRSNDTYISLSKRYSIANSNNADLFVSIHANSATSTSAKGIETLYKGSKTLAQSIQTGMLNETGATSRGIKYRSDLAVLNGTKMPSALVEIGFISNASEASKIGNNSYQDKLAVGIVNGLAKYTDSNINK